MRMLGHEGRWATCGPARMHRQGAAPLRQPIDQYHGAYNGPMRAILHESLWAAVGRLELIGKGSVFAFMGPCEHFVRQQ